MIVPYSVRILQYYEKILFLILIMLIAVRQNLWPQQKYRRETINVTIRPPRVLSDFIFTSKELYKKDPYEESLRVK